MSDLIAWQMVSVVGALAGWLFVAGYAYLPKHQRGPSDRWFRRWWRSGMGINLMGMSVALAAVFTAFAVDSILGPYPRGLWLTLGALVAAFMGHRTLLLFYDRRHVRPHRVGPRHRRRR